MTINPLAPEYIKDCSYTYHDDCTFEMTFENVTRTQFEQLRMNLRLILGFFHFVRFRFEYRDGNCRMILKCCPQHVADHFIKVFDLLELKK